MELVLGKLHGKKKFSRLWPPILIRWGRFPVVSNDAALQAGLVATLGDLIATPSVTPPSDTRAVCAYLADRLKPMGFDVETLSRAPGVDNVVARAGAGAPQIVFNCHIDTVGGGAVENWQSDPFVATLRDGAVYGLGANNCKGSTAVHLAVAEALMRSGGPQRGEVVFTFVGDEERLGADGLAFLREAGAVRPDILVVGGPTQNRLITEERGVMWARITTTGTAAHAGEPQAGDNAVLRMVRLLAHLDREMTSRLGERIAGAKRSTLNIGRIDGGQGANVVPSFCAVDLDRRLLPSERVDDAFSEITDIVAMVGEPEGTWATELQLGTNGYAVSREGPGVVALSKAIETVSGHPAAYAEALGVSDGRFFADDKIEIVGFGPGDGATSHAPNEHVPVDELVAATHILDHALKTLVG